MPADVSPVNIPHSGYLDVHSHLIPGIDDGCSSLAESLQSISRLQEAGFVGSVCTPHIWPALYPNNTAAAVQKWVTGLRGELAAAGVDYTLWPGGEVRIAPEIAPWMEAHGVPTLGDGRCVLVDYWGGDWPAYADALLDWLLDQDYQPILAHPERMGLDDAELARLVESLADRGVWLQGNLRSLAGGEGAQARHQLQELLRQDRLHMLATDAHTPFDLAGRLAGIDVLIELAGEDRLHQLLADRPRELLAGSS